MPYVSVDVDVDLDEFDTTDLIEELKRRDYQVFPDPNAGVLIGNQTLDLIERIYLLRRTGKDYQADLDKLIYLIIDRLA
jgi:hypothetical protein